MSAQPVDRRRATAERNLEAILDAAEALLARREAPSIAAVAAEAGVSRVTVYAHFATREELLQAVVERTVTRATRLFDDATRGAPSAREALERGISASWLELSRNTAIAEAAAAQLSPDALRRTHEAAHAFVHGLLERGRATGEFRTDVPAEWLVSVFHALLHAAGDDVRAGRLEPDVALRALSTTLHAAYTGPEPRNPG